jgi:tRNA (cytidine(34)-2'-O)-methyltransferase
MAELNIVLVEPQIPQNTGNISRTCAVTGARLHLIRPFGFEISDKHLKRAGLDYWDKLDITYYDNFAEFFEKNKAFFEQLYPVIEKTGVNVLVENGTRVNMGPNREYFYTGQDMVDFLRYLDHPQIHACWDTGHANCRGNRQYDDLVALGNRLDGIHIHDNDGRCDEHTAPFLGTVDWDSVLRGLVDMGYKGYFTFECDNFPMRGGGWPYCRRNDMPEVAKLQNASLELKLMAENYLFETGKYLLETYGVFEV